MTQRSRPFRALLLYFLFVFVGGPLFAPWLYWSVQALAPESAIAHSPFHRYVNRALLGFALLAMWPLLRNLGARSCRDLGLISPSGQGRRAGYGFVIGFGTLALAALVAIVAHARGLNESFTTAQLAGKIMGAVFTAVAVAVMEEILFRGAIYGALRRVWDWRAALLVSSMIYAIVHFMASARVEGPVTWTSGLQVLPLMLRGFGDLHLVIPGFFNLTLAGILLGLGYERTGNLYFSMALHAGWIFWLRFFGWFTNPGPDGSAWLFGTQKLIDGWMALVVLAAAVPLVLRLSPKYANTLSKA